MNLYLVITLTGNDHVLIVSSDRELASDYCLPMMSFGQWVEKQNLYLQSVEIIKKEKYLKSSNYGRK